MPLPWFRRKKQSDDAPIAAAAPTVEPEVELPTPTAPGETGAEGQATQPRKRRRGSRGGRGRKKKPATAVAAAASASAPSDTEDGPAEKAETKQSQGERRSKGGRPPRRTTQRRAPLPKAKRELLISVDPGEKRVAALEDGIVAEVYLERPEHRSIAGNIYLGTVDNVLPGMEAAFVEIGLEKNGFLYVDEIVAPSAKAVAAHARSRI